jgi:hypothetical protein
MYGEVPASEKLKKYGQKVGRSMGFEDLYQRATRCHKSILVSVYFLFTDSKNSFTCELAKSNGAATNCEDAIVMGL